MRAPVTKQSIGRRRNLLEYSDLNERTIFREWFGNGRGEVVNCTHILRELYLLILINLGTARWYERYHSYYT